MWPVLTLRSKLAWHSDEDSDDGRRQQATQSRFDRVVVLKGMFLLEDLEKEPELLLELKDDVREEAETLGAVTSVVLYDVSRRSIWRRLTFTEGRGRCHDHQVQGRYRSASLRHEDEWPLL